MSMWITPGHRFGGTSHKQRLPLPSVPATYWIGYPRWHLFSEGGRAVRWAKQNLQSARRERTGSSLPLLSQLWNFSLLGGGRSPRLVGHCSGLLRRPGVSRAIIFHLGGGSTFLAGVADQHRAFSARSGRRNACGRGYAPFNRRVTP